MTNIILVLTGGLGNQLFQIQFLRSLQAKKKCNIYIDISLGSPRGKDGIPDAFEFGMPWPVLDKKNSYYASKVIGYLLRSGYAPTKIEKVSLFRFLIKVTASAILSIHYKKFLLASTPCDLGYDVSFNPKSKNVLTMGYFQSYRYLGNKTENFNAFRTSPESDLILEYRKMAKTEKPIIVHVRRGDYSSEDNFGLLGKKYYEFAISKIEILTGSSKIWLFSDEQQTALELISEKRRKQVRIIQEVEHSSARTLEVMRLGTGYVIANSTFSWWAAQSAYEKNAPVVAPSIWFKKQKSPRDIIPKSWILIDPDFL
jgi:hypothetical protein